MLHALAILVLFKLPRSTKLLFYSITETAGSSETPVPKHRRCFKININNHPSSTPRILDLHGPKFNPPQPSNFAQVVSRRFHCASNAQGSSEVTVCIYLMTVQYGGAAVRARSISGRASPPSVSIIPHTRD